MNLVIRPEQPGDFESIDRVVGDAFDARGEVKLVRLIRERGESLISLVAEADHQVVGHVMVSPIDLDASGIDARRAGWRFRGVARYVAAFGEIAS